VYVRACFYSNSLLVSRILHTCMYIHPIRMENDDAASVLAKIDEEFQTSYKARKDIERDLTRHSDVRHQYIARELQL